MSPMTIGIDPGVMTGVAIIQNGDYVLIAQYNIIYTMRMILAFHKEGIPITLHVENPNLRKYFGLSGREKLQGAGSIKRDYKIWTEFAKEYNIDLVPVAPAELGSHFDNEAIFHAATGYKNKCGIHARDAAMIIFKFKK
ncbi:MAG: hypothetical protein WAU01_14705 [Saprospiraceae bacterium]